MVMSRPPTTLSDANTVSGSTTWNDFSTLTNGAQRNQPRAHTVDENMRILRRSDDTSWAVHTVSTHMPTDEAILMASVGAISRATTCVRCTVRVQVFGSHRENIRIKMP